MARNVAIRPWHDGYERAVELGPAERLAYATLEQAVIDSVRYDKDFADVRQWLSGEGGEMVRDLGFDPNVVIQQISKRRAEGGRIFKVI